MRKARSGVIAVETVVTEVVVAGAGAGVAAVTTKS
jgi:hypothetical protein